jgi:hypothetical protein
MLTEQEILDFVEPPPVDHPRTDVTYHTVTEERWTEDDVGVAPLSSDNPYSFVMDTDWRAPSNKIRAVFAEYVYINMLPSLGDGHGNPTGGNVNYDFGTTVNLAANPDVFSDFVRWDISFNGGQTWETLSDSANCSFTAGTINREYNTIRAVYSRKPIHLTLVQTDGGTATISHVGYNIPEGTAITAVAVPAPTENNTYYKFLRWERSVDNGDSWEAVSSNTTMSFVFEGDWLTVVQVRAVFTEYVNFVRELAPSPNSNGTIGAGSTPNGAINVGDLVTVIGVPNTGAVFTRWERYNGSSWVEVSTDATYTFAMSSAWRYPNNRIRAVFTMAGRGVTVDIGQASWSPQNNCVNYGGVLYFLNNSANATFNISSISPGQNYRFSSWSYSGAGLSLASVSQANTTATLTTASALTVSITANFTYSPPGPCGNG